VENARTSALSLRPSMPTISAADPHERQAPSPQTQIPALRPARSAEACANPVYTSTPKKPNSAVRKRWPAFRLTSGFEAPAYIPGIGHNLQEPSVVG